ncbi:MAG: hypothetical protein LC704_02430 [Actinobacteria bacterium]|nr:hypothetical protein [Actinomycetota bacterium]
MLVRIWRTGVDAARLAEYGEFERERSLPMFREQRGLLGVLFLREADDRAAALTFWEDEEAIQALATSPSYNRTVEALLATGLLRGEQTVEVFEVKDGELLTQELVRELRS